MHEIVPWIASLFAGLALLSSTGAVYRAASRSGVAAVLSAPLAGAAAGAFGWFFVNGSSRVDDVGFLERVAPWPLSDFYPTIAIVAAFESVAAIAGLLQSRARRASIAAAAREGGLAHRESIGAEEVAEYGLPLFKDFVRGSNLIRGERGGIPYETFDYESREVLGSSSRRRTIERSRTVTVLPASTEATWSPFSVRPAGFLPLAMSGADTMRLQARAESVDRPEEGVLLGRVNQLYRIGGRTEIAEDMSRHFGWTAIRLLAARPGWNVECSGTHLAFWRGERVASADERETLERDAFHLYDALRPIEDPPARLVSAFDAETAAKDVRAGAGTVLAAFFGGAAASMVAFCGFGVFFFSIDHDTAGGVVFAWPFLGAAAFVGGAVGSAYLFRRIASRM